MTKKEIIEEVNKAIEKINTSVFQGEEQGKSGIGCNQFREFAECYEEVELQVMYNKAKDKFDPKSNSYTSWRAAMKYGKDTLADVVISCMRKVKDKSSEENCLKNLSLMFGYFYWNARIYAAENKGNDKNQKQNDKNNYKEQNNGGYYKNNNGYKKNQFNNNQNGNYKGSNNNWKRG